MNRTASYQGKVEYTYQWIKKHSNWIPADADNDYDRTVIESLLAMMAVQHSSDWKVVRAAESGEPFLYNKKPVFTSGLPELMKRRK
jgi:hypothetical protein